MERSVQSGAGVEVTSGWGAGAVDAAKLGEGSGRTVRIGVGAGAQAIRTSTLIKNVRRIGDLQVSARKSY
jgi:hypothetical protein